MDESMSSPSKGQIIKHDFEDENDMEDGEVIFASHECSPEDELFDTIIGKLEEIVLEDEFSQKQQRFLAEHCHVFSEDEENKLVYMEIFNKYVAMMEQHIHKRLQQEVRGFDLAQFGQMLKARQDEVSPDIWDLLLSFSDFMAFKELVLSYKKRPGRRSLAVGKLNTFGGSGLNSDFESLTVTGSSPQKRPSATKHMGK